MAKPVAATVHPTAVVAEGARIGAGSRIGPFCRIDAEVEIVGVTPGGRRGKDRDGADRDQISGRAGGDPGSRGRDGAADRPSINRNVNSPAAPARSGDPFEDMVDSVWRF